MDRVDFLNCFAEFSSDAVSELRLPVKMQADDEAEPVPRAPCVYKMRLPDSHKATKKAPYLLHQFITGKDQQLPGSNTESTATVRTVFCVYCEDEQEGAMLLLRVMERLRIAILRTRTVASRYCLDMEAALECLCYPDDTAPYFAGEMVSVWRLPAVEMEVPNWP